MQIALRWRIEKEVITGKGQFICASTRCSNTNELKSWEVNFAYMEDGEKKNALVKIRLCPKCSDKLNYNKQHQEIRTEKEEVKLDKKEIEQESREEIRHEKRKRESFESSNNNKKKKRESNSERSKKKQREGNFEDIERQELGKKLFEILKSIII